MKKYISILLLLTINFLNAQIDCTSLPPLSSGTSTQKLSSNTSQEEEKSRTISLFSQVDLSKPNNSSILIFSDKNDTEKYFILENVNAIKRFAELHSNSVVIKDTSFNQFGYFTPFYLIVNKKIKYEYGFNMKSKTIFTNCGVIKGDLTQILSESKEVKREETTETFTNDIALKNRIKELKRNKESLLWYINDIFKSGKLEFEYIDEKNKVNLILADTFYLNMFSENDSISFQKPEEMNLSQTELLKVGPMLQTLIRLKYKNEDLRVTKWRKLNMSNSYLLDLEYSDQKTKSSLPKTRIQTSSEVYELNYAILKEIR